MKRLATISGAFAMALATSAAFAQTAVPVPATGGQVIVKQQEPKVMVTQPDPTVTVDQARPEVTVEQPQPEITVRQAKPTVNVQQRAPIITVQQAQPEVTVRIPQPIVTVRMPKPDVDVNVARPQVQVQNPEPIVRFVRPEPKILIEEAEAEVAVTEAEADVRINEAEAARVNIAKADAEVNVESAGEARVNVERADAQVRVREAEGAEVNVDQAEARVRLMETEGEADIEVNTAATATAEREMTRTAATPLDRVYIRTLKRNPLYRMRVADIVGQDVYGSRGEEIGEIEDIAVRNDRIVAIVAAGGFLGLGEHEVAMPLERLQMNGERIVLPGMTEEQIEALPEYDYRAVTALPRKRTIEYSVDRM